jgi:ABC-type glycerol-3-phosphate transport system substrate-binding protein
MGWRYLKSFRDKTIGLKKVIILSLSFCVLAVTFGDGFQSQAAERLRDRHRNHNLTLSGELDFSRILKPTYRQISSDYEAAGYSPASGSEIIIQANRYSAYGGNKPADQPIGDRPHPVLVWDKETDWIEWEIEAPSSGLYNIHVDYYSLPGKRLPIQRELLIDGEAPFREAQRTYLFRTWVDRGEPIQNNQGDDVRPKQVEIAVWTRTALIDGNGMYASPFQFYLSEGKHVIRMNYLQEPVAFDQIRIVPPEETPDYEQIKITYDEQEYRPVQRINVKVQAEGNPFKSDPTIRRESNGDPLMEPASEGSFRLNAFGDWRWRKGGQKATWSFNVPESGLYKLGIKAGQWWGDGLPSYRQIQIDGKVPFKEFELYSFAYSRDWRIETLGVKKDDPQLVYLTKGEHTLTLVAQVGPYQPIIEALTKDTQKLSEINRRIIMVTGPTPDPNFDYDLEKRVPGLINDIQEVADDLAVQMKALTAISDKEPSIVNSLRMMKNTFERMAARPDTIPLQLSELNNSQTNLGVWLINLQNQPLVMDYFLVSSPDTQWPNVKSNVFQRMRSTYKNFLASFTKDYTGIGSIYNKGSNDSPVIQVWVSRGREWAEIMKEMAEEDFTPKTGIRINLNTLPAGQLNSGTVNTLLLAASSGRAPDVATGVDAQLPVEFAIREASVDLSQFADYSEVSKRFLPGALIPFQYRDGNYALPETQDFNLLIYRKDILKELGLGIPETWDQVYEILPVLQQNGLQFYYPPASLGFMPFLYQSKGEFYSADGLRSALDSPQAFQAFTEWTELYTNYKFPVIADFFNRFRTGEMPIGVANYWTYVLLSTAAPELLGRWGIAPSPGHLNKDGTIDRTTGGQLQSTVIFKQSEKQKEAWEFIKWWTSTDVQVQFGQELEALLGVEARWNTANMEAFAQLPWPEEDLKALTAQFNYFKEQPYVLGGYFTPRHVDNAWNRAVLGGMNTRESLEKAVKDINRELEAKQKEFGVSP